MSLHTPPPATGLSRCQPGGGCGLFAGSCLGPLLSGRHLDSVPLCQAPSCSPVLPQCGDGARALHALMCRMEVQTWPLFYLCAGRCWGSLGMPEGRASPAGSLLLVGHGSEWHGANRHSRIVTLWGHVHRHAVWRLIYPQPGLPWSLSLQGLPCPGLGSPLPCVHLGLGDAGGFCSSGNPSMQPSSFQHRSLIYTRDVLGEFSGFSCG